MVAAIDPRRAVNHIHHHDDSDESRRHDEDDADADDNSMTPAQAMAASMTMRADDGTGDDGRAPATRRTNETTTAAERAIMGTIDPDENVADFIFQDENGQLVQQRFLQFLNT